LSKSSSKAPQQVKEKADIKTWIGFIVLILGFLLSLCVYVSNQKTKPLVYRINPSITGYTNANEMTSIGAEFEVRVSSGAIGNVRMFNYIDGSVEQDINYTGGTISEFSSKHNRTFGFFLDTTSQSNYLVQYVLVNGRDGSADLGMLIYTMEQDAASVKYWTSL